MTFIVLACVEGSFRPEPGETVAGARIPADGFKGEADEPRRRGVKLTALTRFPEDDERDAWPGRYSL